MHASILLCSISNYPDAVFGFSQESYSGSEGTMISVGVVTTSTLTVGVTVFLELSGASRMCMHECHCMGRVYIRAYTCMQQYL